MNIALISPSRNAYSETFIQAHKERLNGNIFYYYNGEVPTELEGGVVINSRSKRILDIFKGHFRLNRFSLAEQAVITSFRKNNIDLVFAEYGTTGEALLPICKELQIPIIVHFHGFDASRKELIKANESYYKLFDYASYVVVVSNQMYRDLLKMGCPESKLVFNVYGPREDFLEVKPTVKKQQFIAIGRFTDKKAPYYLILSFIRIKKKFPEARMVLAGDGELWNTCKNLIHYYGLDENISMPGVISKDQYIEYLKYSLAMVQHSITAEDGDSEGTPLAILEASAAGLPVISTKHAGITDVIIDGKTGLLVEEHDVVGMSKKMQELLENNSLAKKMGKNGKDNISVNFSLNRHIKVLDDLIEKTLKV
ncbi:glycosyltransferase involved in cell wall biosynthesis [Salegentibacter sp. 24]|uniref:glycosyltransferase n=1 Tax=Salegentibacter sp. 24 TaxID=2183986 RepID=UPI00105E6E3C|nr:glycosyltransferase [Salegentibacter sp. 24]TDN89148.1 glycosyltransferase involved in cell wall biosynthesis [Salegentibacter sp. 24]